jgi:hypothetical protein
MNISLTTLCLGVFCDCGRITAYTVVIHFAGKRASRTLDGAQVICPNSRVHSIGRCNTI